MIRRSLSNTVVQVVVCVGIAMCVALAILEADISDWVGFVFAVILAVMMVAQAVITYSAGRSDAMMTVPLPRAGRSHWK